MFKVDLVDPGSILSETVVYPIFLDANGQIGENLDILDHIGMSKISKIRCIKRFRIVNSWTVTDQFGSPDLDNITGILQAQNQVRGSGFGVKMVKPRTSIDGKISPAQTPNPKPRSRGFTYNLYVKPRLRGLGLGVTANYANRPKIPEIKSDIPASFLAAPSARGQQSAVGRVGT